MNDTLQPKTLSKVSKMMSEPLGLDPVRDKIEITNKVNLYRNLLFNSYDKFKLFDSSFGCFTPQKFPLDCNDPCDKCHEYYSGFTLSRDMGGIVSAWSNGESLMLRSRWRESHTGIVTNDYNETQIIEVSGRYPTERHLQKSSKLKIFTYYPEDHEKIVKIEGKDCEGNLITLEFCLDYNSFTCSAIKLNEIHNVILPQLEGNISLFQEDDYELSRYYPDEHIPSYKRVKVVAGCENKKILVQATRIFKPIFFDDDIVEIGDDLVVREAARYLRYTDSKDREEIAIAERALSKMYDFLKNGAVARDKARHVNDGHKYGNLQGGYSVFPSSLY